ncbi:MAG: methyltransferase domain-containing protein [Cyanobacteria bacterium REEB67]|nr:methyltransferase domain-containing protein [Cyanobacteria bacterium REEB67]
MLIRKRVPEIMDDPLLAPDLHEAALQGLERLNTLSDGVGVLAGPIISLAEKLNAERPGRIITVLDIACGAGDLPVQLYAHLKKRALNVRVHGLDISEVAVQYASAKGRTAGSGCTFSRHDVLQDELPDGYDVITTSLFTHHLDPPEIKTLMAKMAAKANHLVLVNDLERSWTSLWSVALATRLVTTSAVVHHDGPASVRAAFTAAEMLDMARQAGLNGAKVQGHWPCRILLSWQKH